MNSDELNKLFSEILAAGPELGTRYPVVEYNEHGDSLEITFEPETGYGQWIPPGAITELRAHDDNRLVGLIIHSVSKRCKPAMASRA